jgi:citrate lyase beta subunit
MVRKALRMTTASVKPILERLEIRPEQLAERLGVEVAQVVEHLERPRPAPLVVLDGEDSIAPGPEAATAAITVAVDALSTPDSDASASLRFFRPPGIDAPGAAASIRRLLVELVTRSGSPVPLDGLILPKVNDATELRWYVDVLSEVEGELGLRESVRLGVLVESGSAVQRVWEIADAAGERLTCLIFGIVDYFADLGLQAVDQRHPLAERARHAIINCAGAFGVPAIDAMTLRYPILQSSSPEPVIRETWLGAMTEVFGDAVHGRDVGMLGKWVGHPAQLLAVLLAYATIDRNDVQAELDALDAYERATRAGSGAVIIEGAMADRATDRHLRAKLRRDAALGRIDPDIALAAGLVDAAELPDVVRARRITMGAAGG